MTIKFKVKHLVYIVLTLACLLPLFHYLVVPQYELYQVKKLAAKGGEAGKQAILSKLDDPILPSQKWELIRNYMISNSLVEGYDVYVSPSFSQTKKELFVRFNNAERKPYLEDYVENGPADPTLNTAAMALYEIYLAENNVSKGNRMLDQVVQRMDKDGYVVNEIFSERLQLLLQAGYLEEADRYADEIIDKQGPEWGYMIVEAQYVKAKICLQQGDKQQASQIAEQALADYRELLEHEKKAAPDLAFDEQEISFIGEELEYFLAHMDKAKQNQSPSSLSGKVIRSNGEPVRHAGIFLRVENHIQQSVSFMEPYYTTTDENGNYEIKNVRPGNYQIMAGFTYDQIDGYMWPVDMNDWIDMEAGESEEYDITLHELIQIEKPANKQKITANKIEFEWEPVDEAGYYQLSIRLEGEKGGYLTTILQKSFPTNHVQLKVEDLYNHRVGVMFTDDPPNQVDPLTILALSNPENQISWSVAAYTAEGELITSSAGYRLHESTIGNVPLFYLQERTLTAADRLLLDHKVDQAITAYKESYAADENDVHSLRMLDRLIGLEPRQSGKAEDERVLPYVLELAEKSPAPEYMFRLAVYYSEKRNWRESEKWFGEFWQASDSFSTDGYELGVHGMMKMRQGRLDDATEILKQSVQRDKSGRFIGALLAVRLHEQDDFETLNRLANAYPERPYGEDKHDWPKLIKDMEQSMKDDENQKNELIQVLDWFFQDQSERLEEWLQKTKSTAIKSFIQALQQVD